MKGNINYFEAIESLDVGFRVTLPELKGFWFKHQSFYLWKLDNGAVTEAPYNDPKYKDRKDFRVTTMTHTDIEQIIINRDVIQQLITLQRVLLECNNNNLRSEAYHKIDNAIDLLKLDVVDLKNQNDPTKETIEDKE